MPYSTLDALPDAVKALPKHGQEIYQKAFNAAFVQYKGDEAKSAATAWAAVSNKFEKVDDKWVAKEAIHPHGEHICICPECEKEITVEANVKCNTQTCPDCETQMRAKDIGERRESMSDDSKRDILHSALVFHYGLEAEASPKPGSIDIEEVFEEELIYSIDGQSYKASYDLAEDGKPIIGEPEKVKQITTYEPMESLQKTYSEIIQEAGRRNASLDSGRIKKIIELCQELLSSEEPDISKLKKAVKEASTTLVWLKEQSVMKTEDGQKFPAEAYAYAPSDDSDTWRIRLWEGDSVGKGMLAIASASLSPGGYKGHKVIIPAVDLPSVKRTIRSGYRSLGIEESEIPRWVKEVETRELLQSYTPLTEAKFDKGRATVIVIKPGFNATEDRYYPEEMLKRDYKVFEKQKQYADHPTEAEDKARPERSIKDWVSTLTEVTCDENGIVSGIAEVIEPWFMQKLAALRDKGMLNEMGVSINAIGNATKGIIEGKETLIIEKLVACRSVDFVTEPGAGGVVTFYESDRGHDIDLIEISVLRDRRPDLIKVLEADVRAEITKEVKRMSEQEDRIKTLEGQIGTLTTERDDLQGKITEAEKAQKKAEAKSLIDEAIGKSELPEAAKERILERYVDAESADGVVEAIKAEADYIAKLSESGKVKNLGRSEPDAAKDKAALKESFKKMNPEWTDAQIETAASGR